MKKWLSVLLALTLLLAFCVPALAVTASDCTVEVTAKFKINGENRTRRATGFYIGVYKSSDVFITDPWVLNDEEENAVTLTSLNGMEEAGVSTISAKSELALIAIKKNKLDGIVTYPLQATEELTKGANLTLYARDKNDNVVAVNGVYRGLSQGEFGLVYIEKAMKSVYTNGAPLFGEDGAIVGMFLKAYEGGDNLYLFTTAEDIMGIMDANDMAYETFTNVMPEPTQPPKPTEPPEPSDPNAEEESAAPIEEASGTPAVTASSTPEPTPITTEEDTGIPTIEEEDDDDGPFGLAFYWWYILGGAALLLVAAVVFFILVLIKKKAAQAAQVAAVPDAPPMQATEAMPDSSPAPYAPQTYDDYAAPQTPYSGTTYPASYEDNTVSPTMAVSPDAMMDGVSETQAVQNAYVLVCTEGALQGRSFPLIGEMNIGRDPKRCQICFPKDTQGVSGLHASVAAGIGGVMVTDKGSTYGTFLEGSEKLEPNKPTLVPVGGMIYLASQNCAFRVEN